MTAALEQIAQRPVAHPSAISQVTAVEQSRAIAEVQAAVTVAQQCPRDLGRAIAEMRESCGRLALAQRAFYAVPNRGNGPSVFLARELARIWGNIDFGVKELHRDDVAGTSEMLSYAWDMQANTRSGRSFISPHQRMKKINGTQVRERLVDLNDIYLSNQNTGARAVRETILTVLPAWFSEEAQDICRRTLEHGEGEPLAERIVKMVRAFADRDITIAQLEAKVGRKRSAWTAGDVAEMAIAYTSVTRDGIPSAELFPVDRVNAEDITRQARHSGKPASEEPSTDESGWPETQQVAP